MEIQKRVENDVHIVIITDHMDTNTAPEAERELNQLIGNGVRNIVLDFASLEYISSAGLRVCLATSKKMKAIGGAIRICNLNETVQEVFDISGFSTILDVHSSLGNALEGL
jgi:anti-sigma B factor antagonist